MGLIPGNGFLANIVNNYTPAGLIGGAVENAINPSQQGFTAPTMDPGSAAQVQSNENNLMQTPGQEQQTILNGTGSAAGMANQAQNQTDEQNEQGGGGINGMTSAIGNKALKNFSTSQGKLQQTSQIQGMQMANQNMNIAASNAIAMQNAQTGVNSQINQYNLQSNAARYQTISSLMAGAGSIGGAIMGQQAGGMNNPINVPGYGQNTGTSPYTPSTSGGLTPDNSSYDSTYSGMGEIA